MRKHKLTEHEIKIAKEYLETGKSARMIADEYSVNMHSVRYWAKKYVKLFGDNNGKSEKQENKC